MHIHSNAINDGLLRLHAKITALSEIFGTFTESGITIGNDAAFGFHCMLDEIAAELRRLKDLNEKGETA